MSLSEDTNGLMYKKSLAADILVWHELDREMTPIIAELETLSPGNDDHPVVRQLFNWLKDLQRTGEEFTHVIGKVAHDVNEIMRDHFEDYMFEFGPCTYLGKLAAEALAVRCPILEGPREEAVCLVLSLCKSYIIYDFGIASRRLSAWIIQMIGAP